MRGEWVDPALGRCTFARWADQWAATVVDLRPATKDRDLGAVRVHLVPYFGDVPLARITNLMVRKFVAEMLETDKPAPATVPRQSGLIGRPSSAPPRMPGYGHLYEGLDTHIADGLDDLLRHSRGLPAASAPFEVHRDGLSNDNDAGHG